MSCLSPVILDLPVIGTLSVFAGSLLFALLVWKNHQFAGKSEFMAAELGMLWWLWAAAMELSSPALECKLFWSQAAWPGIVLMPSAWAMFLFHYSIGHDESLPRLKKVAIWIGPIVATALTLSNPYHHLVYTEDTRLVTVNDRLSVDYEHGPIFFVIVAYVYAYMLASIGVGVNAIRRAIAQLRPFFVIMMLITLIPIAANLAYILGGMTLFGFDPTPFMFSFVMVAFGWLAVNNRVMDITSVARDLLFDSTANPILIFDDNGLLSGMNRSAKRVLMPSERGIGTDLSRLPQIGPLVAEALRSASLPPNVSVMWGSRTYDPRLTALPSPINPNGPAVGWTIAFIDITEQQAQADLLAQSARQAEAANHAKSEFLSTVSHELRTPLTSIQGALDIVQITAGDKLPEQAAQLIKIASNNTRRLKTLIDDLLDLQRMEQGLMEFQMAPIDLIPVVKDSVVSNKGYLDGYGVEAVIDLPNETFTVSGDQKRLTQVLANLLSNAAKFSDNGKTVEISMRREDGNIAIMVRDHGVGIPPDCEDKVFGRFSQVDSAATRSRGGSGLGLNITQEILEAHKGTIRYESQLGQGTTFIVTLPAA